MSTIATSRNNAISEIKFTVKPELLNLLKTVGAQGNYFSFLEVKYYLGEYIKFKQLVDPSNIYHLNAENDPLGQVFGKKHFHPLWALKQLQCFLIPLGTTTDSGIDSGSSQSPTEKDAIALKRKLADLVIPSPKRICNEYYFEISNPPKPDSETETVCSLQGYETAVAFDSDDFYFSSTASEDDDRDFVDDVAGALALENNQVLLHPNQANQSDNNDLHDDDDDDDEIELEFEYEVSSTPSRLDSDTAPSVGDAVEFIMQTVETDMEFWADSSNCEADLPTSEDPDITDGDKWTCKHCKSLNVPTLRYCERCWQLRHNWLPENRPRPPKRLRKKRQRDRQRMKNQSYTFKTVEIPLFKEEPTAGSSSQNATNNSNEILCLMCFDRPCDGCIVHGSTGHMIGCYKCLKTLKHYDKPCPICRAPIQKVIRVFKE